MGHAAQQLQYAKAETPSLAAELADLSRALRGLFDPYRPERHYMRGPGPKWRAKHLVPSIVDNPAVDCALQLR